MLAKESGMALLDENKKYIVPLIIEGGHTVYIFVFIFYLFPHDGGAIGRLFWNLHEAPTFSAMFSYFSLT